MASLRALSKVKGKGQKFNNEGIGSLLFLGKCFSHIANWIGKSLII